MDFETLWETRHESPCPLNNNQMENMIVRAMEKPASVDPTEFRLRHTRRWWIPVGAVAAVAAMVIPVTMHYHATPKQVEYQGQSVRFISNHNCEVDSVIRALDIYLANL